MTRSRPCRWATRSEFSTTARSSRSTRRYKIYNKPKNIFVASFVGSPSINLIPAEFVNGHATALSGKLKMAAPTSRASGAVTIGIRSEDITVGPKEQVAAHIHDVENHGVEKIVTLRVDDQFFKATAPSSLELKIDGTVKFSFNPDKLHFFDAANGASWA